MMSLTFAYMDVRTRGKIRTVVWLLCEVFFLVMGWFRLFVEVKVLR